MSVRARSLVLALPFVVACGGSDATESVDATGTSDGEAGAADDGDTGGGESAEETETGEPAMPEMATGISITRVTTNQGTDVDISTDGVWVDGSDRRTFIIGERDTLVQVHYTVDEDWVARDIEARLRLTLADGTERVLSHTLRVTGNSVQHDLNRIFYFGLVTENGETSPNTQFQVELWETAIDAPVLTPGRVVSPEAGPNFVGFQGETMEMNVMFVPIAYTPPGGNTVTVTLSDADKEYLIGHTLEQNPLQKVTAVFHDPVPYDQEITSLGQLLTTMSNLRNAEGNAFTNIYYAALVEVNYPGNVAGIARLANANPASERINANVWYSTNNSDTVVHEIGHNQGLSHVACPGGNSEGNDPAYPDPNGVIQQFGFGIEKFTIHRESEFDYMTYCGPSWVSPWTWDKTFWRILELTSWDYDGYVIPEAEPVLKGMVYDDGRTEWWTAPGSIDPERLSGNHTLTFEIDGQPVEALATVELLSDERTQWLEAPLPAPMSQISRINYRGDRLTAQIDPAEVTLGWTDASR